VKDSDEESKENHQGDTSEVQPSKDVVKEDVKPGQQSKHMKKVI